MNIFFCGSVLNYEGLKNYKGEPPASSQWIKGFVEGLNFNNTNVTNISAIWDSLFPKGKLLPGNKLYLDTDLNQELVKYINLPLIREYSVGNSIYKSIKKQIANGNLPDVIFNYNTYPYYVRALKRIKKEYPSIKWINIILDLDDPSVDNWKNFLSDTLGSDGSVFLSWWGYENAPIKNKFHLDCGWNGELPTVNYTDEIKFIHAGKNAKYGGTDELIEVIRNCRLEYVSFHFYGKDSYSTLTQLAELDKRVVLHGFVSNEELDEACRNATAFLSPRELNFQGTKMIFPSKLLTYLKYQKPIISAILPGLSPDYSDLLIVPETNDSNGWNDAINKILNYTEIEFNDIKGRSNELLVKKHWNYQTNLLLNFINKLT